MRPSGTAWSLARPCKGQHGVTDSLASVWCHPWMVGSGGDGGKRRHEYTQFLHNNDGKVHDDSSMLVCVCVCGN